jgi:hypothetical protein
VAWVCPPDINTEVGTDPTDVLLEPSVTVVPALGAIEPSVTVPEIRAPPTDWFPLIVSPDNVGGGSIASVAVELAPAIDAVNVATECAVTPVVVTANVAVVLPVGMVTVGGAEAALVPAMPSDNDTGASAGALRFIVPVAPSPPTTSFGVIERLLSNGPT